MTHKHGINQRIRDWEPAESEMGRFRDPSYAWDGGLPLSESEMKAFSWKVTCPSEYQAAIRTWDKAKCSRKLSSPELRDRRLDILEGSMEIMNKTLMGVAEQVRDLRQQNKDLIMALSMSVSRNPMQLNPFEDAREAPTLTSTETLFRDDISNSATSSRGQMRVGTEPNVVEFEVLEEGVSFTANKIEDDIHSMTEGDKRVRFSVS